MKPLPQFFALLRYFLFASPWIWVFPFAFGVQPCLILFYSSGKWNSGMAELASLTTLGMLPMMTSAFIFAGDKLLGGTPGFTPQTYQQVQTFSGEFLLTRAVDRLMVFRARMAFYWMLILLPLLVLVFVVAWRPELTVTVPAGAPAKAQFYLERLPGASMAHSAREGSQAVVSPFGWLAFGGTVALAGAALAAVWPVIVLTIVPLRFRRWIFWGLFLAVIFLPLAPILNGSAKTGALERGVLWAMNHLLLGSAAVLVLAVLGFFLGAARDREIEYS